MASDWKSFTLGEVCSKITDGAHQSPKSVDTGKPMCSVKDLTEFGLTLSTARQISEKDYQNLLRQGCMPEVGDVLIAKDGNSALDTVCSVDTPVETVLLSSVAILRPNPLILDTDFLKYYFKSKRTIAYLKNNFISGAAIPRVVLKDFKKAIISLPSLNEQRQISKLLRSLDEKIQANNQINETLQQMAQAIFKSWFVDFEPVKTKIAVLEAGGNEEDALLAAMQAISGKDTATLARLQTEHPDQYNELRTTAKLFPSAMQNSELGEIPITWHQTVIYDLATYINGAAYKKFEPNNLGNGLPIVKIAELKAGITERTGFSIVDMPEKYKLRDLDILFSWSGNPDTSIDTFVWSLGEAWLNQHIFKVVPKTILSRDYVLCLLRHMKPVFADIARDKQTTGLGHVTVQDLKKLFVVMPNENLLNKFNEIIQPLLALNFCLVKQVKHLEQIRDSALPKLLSGELTVDYLNEMSLEAANV